MKEKLQALYYLQQADSKLDQLKRQYAALDPGRAEQARLEEAKAALAEAQSHVHTTQASIRDAELQQQQIEAKRSEFEKKLYGGTVRVPKELQALQEEIEMLGRQRARLDEQILTLMDEVETARQRDAAAAEAFATAEAALREKQAGHKHNAERITAEARQAHALRTKLAAELPPDMLKRYDSLRASKAGVAVGRLEDDNACSVCRMGLPNFLVDRIHAANAVLTCDNCGRIVVEVAE